MAGRAITWAGLVCWAWVATVPACAWAKIDDATRYVERSASLLGPTGWIDLPSADIGGSGEMAAGIHRADAKINVAAFNLLEAGVHFRVDTLADHFEQHRDLSGWDRAGVNLAGFIQESFTGNAKIKVLDQDWAEAGLAVGWEQPNWYIVAQRYFARLSHVTILAGWGSGRFSRGFGGLSKTLLPGAEAIFEFDGTGMNVGLRMLLARNLVLTLAIQDLNTIGEVQNLGEVIGNHFLFGITYVERLW